MQSITALKTFAVETLLMLAGAVGFVITTMASC